MINNINPISTLKGKEKYIAKFINVQESKADLSMQRIAQELVTNTLPKSLFARGVVDLCDNAFREILENIIVYLGPKFVGEKIFRKAYSSGLKDNLKTEVFTNASKLMENNKNPDNKVLMPVKAAIAISALAIPLAEYSLSYVKNLFTLKMFKKADFNNIANLNKDQKENTQHQEKVKESAKKHIKLAGGLFAGCLSFAILLAKGGKNSGILNHISEAILAPGSKFFKENEGLRKFFNKYFGLDFNSKEVVDKAGKVKKKLSLSNGQITACVTAGFFGYTGAAKDRGKQDYKEVLYRFPLVGFYAISGNELFTKAFHKFAQNSAKFKEIFAAQTKNGGEMPTLEELATKYSEMFDKAQSETSKELVKKEFKTLFNQKAMLIGAPALFGFTVMGLFVAGLSRYFTQYRYNKEVQAAKA